MTEWFQAGYFTMTLLVKRGCDEVFQPLGEIIKIWGRVPFTPGPAPPPILVSKLKVCMHVVLHSPHPGCHQMSYILIVCVCVGGC